MSLQYLENYWQLSKIWLEIEGKQKQKKTVQINKFISSFQ